MDISIFPEYSDATHIFGICHVRRDGLDRFGRTAGVPDESGRVSIHREGLTKDQAIDFIREWIEDGGDPEAFRIVATRRPLWETVESGSRARFVASIPTFTPRPGSVARQES